MRRTAIEWKRSPIAASIEWNLSSAGAQNHNETADVELTSHENTIWICEWNFHTISLCISNAWHTQLEMCSCYRCATENERSDTKKKNNKRKVEEKVAAQQRIVGTVSLYQVLNTIGYVPVRLVISYHSNIMWMRKKSQQNELSCARHSKRYRIYRFFDKKKYSTKKIREKLSKKKLKIIKNNIPQSIRIIVK